MEHLPLPQNTSSHATEALCRPLIGTVRDSLLFQENWDGLSDLLVKLNKDNADNSILGHLFSGEENSTFSSIPEQSGRPYYLLESLIKATLWFSALRQFESACKLPLDWSTIQRGTLDDDFSTAWLPAYIRSVVIERIIEERLPITLVKGDKVRIKNVGNAESSNGFLVEDKVGLLDYKLVDGAKEVVLSAGFLEYFDFQKQQPTRDFVVRCASGISSAKLCVELACFRGDTKWEGTATRIVEAENLGKVRAYVQEARSHNNPILSFYDAVVVDALCENLSGALENIFNQRGVQKSPSFIGDEFDHLMLEKNWCPARTAKLLTTAPSTVSYLLTNIDSYDTRTHLDCSGTKCSLNPPESALKPSHLQTACTGNCDMVTITQSDLVSVLRLGGIPCIERQLGDNGEVKHVVCDIRKRRAVAISHVWSHGLGNRGQNGLPRCRLNMLFAKIQNLPNEQDSALWIDTLSIPIDREWKRIAITKLPETYSTASKVLVIDQFLMQVGEHWLEQRLQLLCAEWQRRLWTLQEGRLAKEVFIQFRQSARNTGDLITIESDEDNGDSEVLHNLRRTTGFWVRELFSRVDDPRQRLLELTQDLAYRATTVASDEAICIAVLMNLPLDRYFPRPGMDDIYNDLQHLPRNLMFLPGDRIGQPGLRWAPSSILGHGTFVNYNASRDDGTRLTPDGLQVEVDCLRLESTIFYGDSLSLPELYFIQQGGVTTFALKFPQRAQLPPHFPVERPIILLERDGQYLRNGCTGILASEEEPVGPSQPVDPTDQPQQKPAPKIPKCSFRYHVQVSRFNEFNKTRLEEMSSHPLRRCYVISGVYQQMQSFCVD